MSKTSPSSGSSPTPEAGATDSLWRPSRLRWLISALSGTVETEKQIAWLKRHNEELRKSNEEWLKNEQMQIEEMRHKNKRLAELQLKLNEILHS